MGCPQFFVECVVAGQQRRQVVVDSWVHHTLQTTSIDMAFCTSLVAKVCIFPNLHWVPCLLLIALAREYICFKFDPLCNQPPTVGANMEESEIEGSIAQQEDIQTHE